MIKVLMQSNEVAMMLHMMLTSITFGRAFFCFLVYMNHGTQQYGQEYHE